MIKNLRLTANKQFEHKSTYMSNKVILAIKPEFAEKILSGEKRFEFRRSIWKKRNVKTVLIYASAPVSKVIGEFEVKHIHLASLLTLWNFTKDKSPGINKEFFDSYFEGKTSGFAVEIMFPTRYIFPLDIGEDFGKKAPQNFTYCSN